MDFVQKMHRETQAMIDLMKREIKAQFAALTARIETLEKSPQYNRNHCSSMNHTSSSEPQVYARSSFT